ncbi:hypothetical protein TI05_13030, partial [Achromatium sp. WMS3]
ASDAVDDSNADQVNGGGYVTALITAIPASGTATVEFTVTVEAGATGTIDNTPFFCYDNGADVIPSGAPNGNCDSGDSGNPNAGDIPTNHETGNTVTFSVLLDFLQKFQALDTNCDGTIEGSYTQSQLTAGAEPGVCIRYKIVASNNTGNPVTNVMVYDQTPAYTVFDDGSRGSKGGTCGTVSPAPADARTSIGGTVAVPRNSGEVIAPACGGTGAVNASLGSLDNGSSADFRFGVMIQNQ